MHRAARTAPRIAKSQHEAETHSVLVTVTLAKTRRRYRSELSIELRGWHSSQTVHQIPIQIYIKISLMYRMRSKSCRFSEFRTSQCVSQFAAFFLDPRTKAFTVANIVIGHYSLIGQLKSQLTSSNRSQEKCQAVNEGRRPPQCTAFVCGHRMCE